MAEYQYGYNTKMASKSNAMAIMKLQLIHENTLRYGNDRAIAGANKRAHDWNKVFTTFHTQ